jgi:hypothetical protein
VAGALDADPFSLLLLRGRRRDEVLAGLRARRRSAEVTMTPQDRSQPAADPGVDALRTTWQPAATDLAVGRAALDRPAGQGVVRTWRNRLTRSRLQLRLGSDGLWYRFLRSGSDWVLDGPPSPEPDTLLIEDAPPTPATDPRKQHSAPM